MKTAIFTSALLALTVTPAFAGNNWDTPAEPYRIADNVWFVGTEGIGAYLITTPKGHILIDSGTQKGAGLVEANIVRLGFAVKDVKILLESHAHFDHIGGMAKLKADTGATFIASAADRPILEGGRHIGDNENGTPSFAAVKVDRLIGHAETVSLGGVTLTAHLTPGHTQGCTTWTMPVVINKKAHRAVFFCSTTTAGNVLVGNKTYPGIVADYRLSFKRLKAIRADVFLVNHPDFAHMADKRHRQIAGDADAFVDPSEFQAFVAKSEQAFETELKKQTKK
ncbi:MAG: subclass B3 metallo-beta-lactamase [Asticcacaulis sp.]